ncbi:MAG: hypothetical protein ACM31L_13610 [Actinomycetota bacterium]
MSETDKLAGEAAQLLADGQLEQASARINQALAIKLDRSYYHLINGLTYHLMALKGQKSSYDLAQQGYEMAIRFDPSNWMARYFLGRLFIETRDFNRAKNELAEALVLNPRDRDALSAFAYAAYRSGNPDLAAGAIKTIEEQGGTQAVPAAARNAPLVMAAVGDTTKAWEYLKQLEGRLDISNLEWMSRRIRDWEYFHKDPRIQKAQYDPATGLPSFGAQQQAPDPMMKSLPTAPGTENKMVVVDVVMIATEETFTTAKGVNLLNGLTMQFGTGSSSALGANMPAWGFSDNLVRDGASTHTIARAISIPAITYTLNIMNSTSSRDEVLARPTLIGLAGQPSEFFSGNELNAAAVAGASVGGNPILIQKEIGVKLVVTPAFLPDGQLRLGVSAQRTFIRPASSDVNFQYKFEMLKHRVEANVVMRFGETLILGGLSEKETQGSRDGVPGLQEVPGLQYLFSRNTTLDYQKSILILLTPRPTQYVYQPEKARQEYEKSLGEDERPIAALRARYADWFKPYPNWASVFHHLQENSLYREFRTGDVDLESWSDMRSLRDRLHQLQDFMHY